MRTRSLACAGALGAALVGLGALAGCGTAPPVTSTSSLAPRDAVGSAVNALLAGRDLTVTVRLDTTTAALIALSADPGEKPMSETQAKALVGGSLTYSVHMAAGHSLAEQVKATSTLPAAGTNESFLVHAGNGAEGEVRLVNGALFGRVDLVKFADLAQSPLKARTELLGAAAGVDVPAPYRAAVTAGLRGDWVSLAASTVHTDAALLASLSANPLTGTIDEGGFEKALLTDIARQAVITRVSSNGADDHLRASMPLRQLAKDGYDALNAVLTAALPGGTTDPLDLSTVPNQVESVDITTHDGVLSDVHIDLAANVDPKTRASMHGQPLGLDITFAAAPVAVVVPASFTTVDPTPLLKAFAAEEKAAAQADKEVDDAPTDSSGDISCPTDLPTDVSSDVCKDGMINTQ
jgi:hypothetical protein